MMATYSEWNNQRISVEEGAGFESRFLHLLVFGASISSSENGHYTIYFRGCCKDEMRQMYETVAQCLANSRH